MGFLSGLGNRVKGFLSQDKNAQAHRLARGATAAGALITHGRDMLNTFGYDSVSAYVAMENDLLSRYADYEVMDESPEIAAAINIYADEATQNDYEKKKPVWVKSPDKTIEDILDKDLLTKRLRFGEEEVWEIARTAVKSGNDYEELLVDNTGVVGLNFLPPATMRRIEGPRGELYGFVQDFRGRYGYTPYDFQALLSRRAEDQKALSQGQTPGAPGAWGPAGRTRAIAFEPWEIVHFRLHTMSRRSVYGTSALEPARWIFKRLQLLEDSSLIYRLQRAPERFAFYVDVGDLPPAEAMQYVNRVRQQYKKRKYYDPSSGRLNLKWDGLNSDDDIYVPVRKGQEGARVEVLGAPQWQCLLGNTKIPLLDGSEPTISELSKCETGFWLYSCTEDGDVVPGYGHSARVSHDSAEIWEVGLDNGEVIECTGNHPFLTRGGQWVLAENLQPGVSLMPLYRHKSMKKKGDFLVGYEQVLNPSTNKYVYTHHLVFDSMHGVKEEVWAAGGIIHHKDHNKLNNSPENLEALSRKAHAQEHRDNAIRLHTPEVLAKIAKTHASPEYRARLRASWTDERRVELIERTKQRMQDPEERAAAGRRLTDWNKSEERRSQMRGAKHPRWVDLTISDLADLVQRTGARTMKELLTRGGISQGPVERILKTNNMRWSEFASAFIPGWVPKGRAACKRAPEYKRNHKVTFVRKTSRKEKVYDLTVDKHHNFAVAHGVFVHNSMDDINYFRDKQFAGIGVPKSYLSQEKGVPRQILSNQDVTFARAVLRVQRELRNGIWEICRTHLAALGIDPYRVEYEVFMTPPSSIYELAQIEVMNARADLAARMKEFVSEYWILSHIFGIQDEDIKVIMKQREEDWEKESKHQLQFQDKNNQQQLRFQDLTNQQQIGFQVQSGVAMQNAGLVPPPEPAAPPAKKSSKATKKSEAFDMLVKRIADGHTPENIGPLPGMLRERYSHGNWEKAIMTGDRRAEKRAEDKIDQLLANDKDLQHRMFELSGLLSDLRTARHPNGKSNGKP